MRSCISDLPLLKRPDQRQLGDARDEGAAPVVELAAPDRAPVLEADAVEHAEHSTARSSACMRTPATYPPKVEPHWFPQPAGGLTTVALDPEQLLDGHD